MTETKPFDTVQFCMEWEMGDLTADEVAEGFQHLIDSGTAWSLQGMYGRMAHALIENGQCTLPSRKSAE